MINTRSLFTFPNKNACLLFFCNLLFVNIHAQLLTGITNKPDTSYTTYSAYKNSIANNPNIKIVGDFNYNDIDIKKNITYCSIGGRNLMIDAFTPKQSSAKRVAVIMIHGGGWRSGNRMQHWPLAESLAHLDYVCFTPEYRLSTEALFPAAIYDIKAAIRWVKANASQYNIDTTCIAIAGFSAGGEMAAFMGTTGNMPLFEGNTCNTGISTHVNAVVDIDGTLSFVHPESGEGNDSTGRISAGTYWFGYNKKENPGLWLAASPLTYVSSSTPPTLFLNSSVDRMHAGRGDYIKILNENNTYTEVHTFKDAPHSFPLFSPWFEPMVQYIDGFLKKVFP
jgi:acetyl esterase/lipase